MSPGLRSKAGFAFFLFAGLVAFAGFLAAPDILQGLRVAHTFTLAGVFALRRPAQKNDAAGLLLGLIALFLPLPPRTPAPGTAAVALGAAGYALTLWSLLALGRSFGIAPADRGLIQRGPYRWIRHPMYLGELTLNAAILWAEPLSGGLLWCLLAGIQVARITREEKIIAGYAEYARRVPGRLIPGVW